MSRSNGYYDDGYPDYRAQSTSTYSYYSPDYYGDHEYPKTDQGLDPYTTEYHTYEPFPDDDRGRRSPQHRSTHNRSTHSRAHLHYETDRRVYNPFPSDSRRFDREYHSPSRRRSSSPTVPPLSSSPAYNTHPRSRSRSLTPPPVPSSPTPSYLAASLIPSSPIPPPLSPRKLLILDLNGTLLLRSAHRAGKGRIAYPRPYMTAFREYLMHEETRQWLDVMVWSSAQPHSVADMVHRCFAEDKEKLVAIWARDTLGLSKEDYSRKAQTLKDLAKPWSQLPSPPSDTQRYSARTTLLLDDSPLKARLQPYNHLCIKEYAAETRARDLAIKSILDKRLVDEAHEAEEDAEAETNTNANVRIDGAISGDAEAIVPSEGKRKRKRAKQKAPKRFDETLLAVIGILDEIREQSNVSAWIRSGGLWIDRRPPSVAGSSDASDSSITAVRGRTQSDDDAAEQEKDGEGQSPPKRHRKRRAETLEADSKPAGMQAVAELAPTGNDAFTRASPEASLSSPSADPAGDGSSRGTIAQQSGEDHAPMTSNSKAQGESETLSLAPMWFEDATTFQQWSDRGAAALEVLGIEVVHGIDR